MTPDFNVPDSAPIFEQPPKREYGKWCIHAGFKVVAEQRQIVCLACNAQLDPFDILLRQAHRAAICDNIDDEIKRKRASLEALYGEERRVKGRVRGAKKKDADAAVAAAIAKQREGNEHSIFGLLTAQEEIAKALKRMGYDRP